ncbi:Ig-like domain-containing protein, partial [Pseudomonas aeruginosa]|uniref:Ig-like domain-containing protein n=1 Tax=Pseudomonas aeruginosa TaxID=287 RepID=UPI001C60BF16
PDWHCGASHLVAPLQPVIEPRSGVVIGGMVYVVSTVILTCGNGYPIGHTTADGSGNWAFTPATPLANGTVINALAQDAAGNNSSPTSATVDSLAPAASVIAQSTCREIDCTAVSGSMVILTCGNTDSSVTCTDDGSEDGHIITR